MIQEFLLILDDDLFGAVRQVIDLIADWLF
jgi:hypothetical protein